MSRLAIADRSAYALALVLVLALGALNLNYPFIADQVIALLGAKALAAGGTLYLDFWDNKMPGLFWFYRIAGAVFGFDEIGVHLLELIWMTAFALVLMITLRGYCAYPWMSALAPVAVVGVYYAAADPFHLTQVEILSALPLYLVAWIGTRHDPRGERLALAWLASGLLGGVILTLKLVLAPLFVVLWLTCAAHAHYARRLPPRTILSDMLLPAALGTGLVVLAVAAKFWSDGALRALYWTAFDYPPQALAWAPRAPCQRLLESSLFFLSFYLAWAFFIALAIADWWYRERHLMTSLMLAWAVAAVGVILIQRFSWWPYHFLLLFAPCGILGVRGIGVIPRVLRARGAVGDDLARLLVLALAFPAVASLAVPTEQKLSAHFDVFVSKLPATPTLQIYVNHDYRRIQHSVRFLAADSARPGPIYVFGDPLYYYLSGRDPALPIPGWPWQYFLQSQWVQLPRQLEQALPAYLYIDKKNQEFIEHRGGGVGDYIRAHYVPFTTDHNGTWYQILPERLRARATPGTRGTPAGMRAPQ